MTSRGLSLRSNPVLLWSVKPAEEGIAQGVMARLWNVSGTPQDCALTLVAGLAAAQQTTHLETDLRELPVRGGEVSVPFAAQQMQTMRLTSPALSK